MSQKVVISLKNGKVRGVKERSSVFDADFYSFYGIPYAQPPVGSLRFKDPVKVKPWKVLHDGSIKKEGCLQFSLTHRRLLGSEDCLYVNVYTPRLRQEGEPSMAVIAFIHFGGQLHGGPDALHQGPPDFIMHRDIVYVTIGYRLNIFGFLNLKLPECSGNQGLKDIIMAFRWIEDNIHEFNGDPANVTALGSSSGASLVHLLMLSPAAKGLFHKAILMGQNMFNCLVPYRINQLELALEFGHQLGFKGDRPIRLLKFLKTIPGDVLVTEMKTYLEKLNANVCKAFEGGVFMESPGDEIFPVSLRQLIDSTQRIPVIYGICDKESVLGFVRPVQLCARYFRQSVWGWPNNLNDDELRQMYQLIESFYFKATPTYTRPLSIKMDVRAIILTDAAHSEIYDTLLNVISADLSSSVYVYKFQYVGENSELRQKLQTLFQESVEGTFHIDDLCYWVNFHPPRKDHTIQVIDTFTKLLTSFAKTGNPNYEGIETQWKPTTPEEPCYLDINSKLTMIEGKLNNERFLFWDNLKKQFYRA